MSEMRKSESEKKGRRDRREIKENKEMFASVKLFRSNLFSRIGNLAQPKKIAGDYCDASVFTGLDN